MACKTSMNEMNSHYIFCILHYVSISFRHKKICRSIRVNGLRTYISFSQKNLCQFCYSIMKFNVLISELSHENENENKSLICSGTSFSYIFQYIWTYRYSIWQRSELVSPSLGNYVWYAFKTIKSCLCIVKQGKLKPLLCPLLPPFLPSARHFIVIILVALAFFYDYVAESRTCKKEF